MVMVMSLSRRSLCALFVIALCLATPGCDMDGHVMVELPMELTWTDITSTTTASRYLGDGSNILVHLDLKALPAGTSSDQIGAASMRISASPASLNSGSVQFSLFFLTAPLCDDTQPVKSDENCLCGVIAHNARPLSICNLTFDSTLVIKGYSIMNAPDFSAKHLNFDITKAVRAWLDGSPYKGLKLVQTTPACSGGPRWKMLSSEDDKPRAAVWVKKAGRPGSPGE